MFTWMEQAGVEQGEFTDTEEQCSIINLKQQQQNGSEAGLQ